MSKKIDYSGDAFSPNRLPVAIDFSRMNVINDPKKLEEEVQAELVNLQKADKAITPIRKKIVMGSYVSQHQLKEILKKEKRDRAYYQVLTQMKKGDKDEDGMREDFALLRDFFPTKMVEEVRSFVEHIFPKFKKILVEDKGLKKVTPRKRRGMILAVFKSIGRKSARKFTDHLLEEINNRFCYDRRIRMFEIAKWENFLIKYKLLFGRTEDFSKDKLKNFCFHVVTHCMNLRKDPAISEHEGFLETIAKTKQFIIRIVQDKEKKKNLAKILKHREVDFAARMIVWTIAKEYLKTFHEITLKFPEEEAGWRRLFLVDEQEEIPIRTWKFVYWNEFHIRKELKEQGLFPEENK